MSPNSKAKSHLLSALLVNYNKPVRIYHNITLGVLILRMLYTFASFLEESSHLLGSFQILLESLKGAID